MACNTLTILFSNAHILRNDFNPPKQTMSKRYNKPSPEALALLEQVEKANTTINEAQQAQRLAWIHAYVKSRGGTCPSLDVYVTAESKFTVRCANGHEWQSFYTSLSQGTWCKQCYFDAMRFTLADMQELARSRGGECLSTVYLDIKTPLLWRCQNGHEWYRISRIIQTSWCAQCHFDGKRTKIEDIKAWASTRGLTCLSDEHIDHRKPLNWRCDRGHEWQALWKGFKRAERASEPCRECREMLRQENRQREQRRKKADKVVIGKML
jgi:hypothetical protein